MVVGAYVLFKPSWARRPRSASPGHQHTVGRDGHRSRRSASTTARSGPGTGSFFVFTLVGLLGYNFLEASAKARLANWATNLAALCVFVPQGAVLWKVGLVMGACNLLGGYLGARTAVARGRPVRPGLLHRVVSASSSGSAATCSDSGDYGAPLMATRTAADPPFSADEVATLRGYLDHHRDTVAVEDRGLTQEQLAQPHAPSEMTLGGMMKHAPLIDDCWFAGRSGARGRARRVPTRPWTRTATGSGRREDDSPEELADLRRRPRPPRTRPSTRRSPGAGSTRRGVDEPRRRPAVQPPLDPAHMIEEYARHNGHADLIREAVDGHAGE